MSGNALMCGEIAKTVGRHETARTGVSGDSSGYSLVRSYLSSGDLQVQNSSTMISDDSPVIDLPGGSAVTAADLACIGNADCDMDSDKVDAIYNAVTHGIFPQGGLCISIRGVFRDGHGAFRNLGAPVPSS